MQTVYKYTLQKNGPDWEAHNVPANEKVLHIADQHGKICVWALVDTDGFKGMRFFQVFGTGHEIPNDGRTRSFVNTFMIEDGDVVFHAFEVDRSHETLPKQ